VPKFDSYIQKPVLGDVLCSIAKRHAPPSSGPATPEAERVDFLQRIVMLCLTVCFTTVWLLR